MPNPELKKARKAFLPRRRRERALITFATVLAGVLVGPDAVALVHASVDVIVAYFGR